MERSNEVVHFQTFQIACSGRTISGLVPVLCFGVQISVNLKAVF